MLIVHRNAKDLNSQNQYVGNLFVFKCNLSTAPSNFAMYSQPKWTRIAGTISLGALGYVWKSSCKVEKLALAAPRILVHFGRLRGTIRPHCCVFAPGPSLPQVYPCKKTDPALDRNARNTEVILHNPRQSAYIGPRGRNMPDKLSK